MTLVAGVVLERTGNQLANNWGMNGALRSWPRPQPCPRSAPASPVFAWPATPWCSATCSAGNAFQLTLFIVADLVAGQPVLSAEGKSNAWIGCVWLLMTAVFVSGIVLPSPPTLGLGLDSWIALLIYALGIWGLVVVSG